MALGLSGGGARAAGFHLGTLAYLARLDLLKDVEILSSVSGGSFVAGKYALTMKRAPEGEPFDETFSRFYRDFYQYLLRADLVPKALERLSKARITNNRHRGFITALADTYDETFLERFKFEEFWEPRQIHLKEIIFNVTEFKTGLAFRFHVSEKERRSGNVKVWISEYFARKARLADIVAASSCIPVGMEPMTFPEDFVWDNQTKTCGEIGDELQANAGVRSVVLMDGGVYDNQGMESIMMVLHEDGARELLGDEEIITNRIISKWRHDSANEHSRLGTMIISDTPVVNETIYGPRPDPKPGRITIQTLNVGSLIIIWLCGLSFLTNVYHFLDDLREKNGGSQGFAGLVQYLANSSLAQLARFLTEAMDVDNLLNYTIPILLAGSVSGSLLYLRHRVKKVVRERLVKEMPAIAGMWKDVKKIRITQLIDMLSLRFSSTWAMSVDVFFNRIRALGYSFLLSHTGLQQKVITHEIYDLVIRENKETRFAPSAAILAPARRAMNMPTQVWIDNEDDLKDLVATGMATMCYNILEYVEARRKNLGDSSYAGEVFQQALRDWKTLSQDPFAFLEEMKETDKPPAAVSAAARAATQRS